jgi:hypothetical protein
MVIIVDYSMLLSSAFRHEIAPLFHMNRLDLSFSRDRHSPTATDLQIEELESEPEPVMAGVGVGGMSVDSGEILMTKRERPFTSIRRFRHLASRWPQQTN